MMRMESDCLDCPAESCGFCSHSKPKPHYYCDCCGEEMEPSDLSDFEGTLVCDACLKDFLIHEGVISEVQDER